MDLRQSPAVEVLARGIASEAPLASLRDEPIASCFHAWMGASGRRYVASVYRLDPSSPKAGLPDFDGFVLIPVAKRGVVRLPSTIVAIERESEKRSAIAGALAHGVSEWHVHLLAAGSAERAAVVADLAARHERTALTLSA